MSAAPSSTPAWWQELSDAALAGWLAPRQPTVALCPDATQRWYYFDHLAGAAPPEAGADYLNTATGALLGLLHLLFDHGLQVVYLPLQVPLRRGPGYVRTMLAHALPALLAHPQMAALGERVRVRHYGPWPPLPPGYAEAAGGLAALRAQLDALAPQTAHNGAARLFLSLQLNPGAPEDYLTDYDQTAGLLGVAGGLHSDLGRPPQRGELLAAYYNLDPGETLPPLGLVLSGMWYDVLGQAVPPLINGHEDYYFPVASLLSLDRPLLRAILYDWLFLRPRPPDAPPTDYAALTPQERAAVRDWYIRHRRVTLGLGRRHPFGDFWYPAALEA